MSYIMAPAEKYITAWQKAGLLHPQYFMDRMDQEIHRSVLYITDADLANITPYMNDLQDGVPAMSQASFQTMLKQQVPTLGMTALEKATPVLFRMFMYISRYPFLPVPTTPEASRLTRNELLRALAFLSLGDDLRFFNNEPDLGTRARTPADHRRLIFQALATSTTVDPIGFDEAAWTAKAAVRARRFFRPSEPADVWETDNAMTNRDADGDECFHDVVDYMYTLQPVNEGQYGGDVRRRDLVETAKDMVAKGEIHLRPLHRMVLDRQEFSFLVEVLLVLWLDGQQMGGMESLPDDFNERKEAAVAVIFGEKEGVNFGEYDDAFDGEPVSISQYSTVSLIPCADYL